MCAADFGGMNVAVSVLLQGAIVTAEHKAGEDDPSIAARARLQIVDVLACVRSIANDQEFVRGADPLERFDYQVCVVLRLKAGNVKHVAVRLDAPASHQRIGTP